MEKKPKILFILFEGLADTVIDSQVLSHIAVLQNAGVSDFEVWAFSCTDGNYEKSLERKDRASALCQAPVSVLNGVLPSKLFSEMRNAAIISRKLEESATEFTHIHARTDYVASTLSKIRNRKKYSLIWDCRGDGVAELSYRYQSNDIASMLSRSIRRLVLTFRMMRAGAKCDRALFVSETLYSRMSRYLRTNKFNVVPCCASEKIFYYNKSLRTKTRNQLGIEDDAKLYIYIGSLASYQCFDETVACFSQILQNEPKAKFLVLTPDVKRAVLDLKATINDNQYIVKYAAFSEINSYLNASDAAFMLRENTPTNQVATPTKFAEYCLVGLPIIMSDAVLACYDMARAAGNIIEYKEPMEKLIFPELSRAEIRKRHLPLLSREQQIEIYRDVYAI